MPTPDIQTSSDQVIQDSSALTPERIWQAVLGQLLAELPKAEFETWVRDIEPLDYENDTFVVGAANAYARDWLQEHLQSRTSNILSQITQRPTDVRFIVGQDYASPQTRAAAAVDSTVEAPTLPLEWAEEAIADVDQRLEIVMRFRRYWEEIVDPEKVVSVSRYFVKYWLPILGPQFSSMVLAFKQLRFLHRIRTDDSFEVHGAEILRWNRVDESTFYHHLNNPHPLLSWFVETATSMEPKFERGEGGRVSRKSRKYIVYGGVPLSPPHQAAVVQFLRELGAGPDPSGTLSALNKALKVPDSELENLLESSFNIYLEGGSSDHPQQPRTVLDIVRGLLGSNQLEVPIERLAKLCEEFENRLVRPDRSLLLTWYFIQNWQPLLKSAAFWFIVTLRSRGFYDKHSTELRDTFWIDGGYAELETILGVSSETISGWLGQNRKASQTKLSRYVRLFVNELDRSRGRNPSNGRLLSIKLKVEMIDPLTPDGENRFSDLAQKDGLQLDLFKPMFANYPEKSKFGDSNYPEISKFGKGEYPENLKFGNADHPEKSKFSEADYPEISKSGEGNYPEKSKHLKDSINKTSSRQNDLNQNNTFTSTTTDGINQLVLPLMYEATSHTGDEVVVAQNDWKLDDLLMQNHIPPYQADLIIDRGVDPECFVAWLLYAFSQDGKGIEKPGFFAASRLLEEPPILPGEKWIRLAGQDHDYVVESIRRSMDPLDEGADEEWGDAMGIVSRERLSSLALALGLEITSEKFHK